MLVPEASKKTCAMISPLNDIVDAYSTIHSYLEALHGDDYILFIEKHVVASAGENFSLDLTFAWYLVLMESKLETAFLRKVIIVFCIVSIYFAPRGFGITRRHSKASKFDFFHGSTEEKNGLLSLGQTCKILNSEFLSDYGNEYVEFWERLKSELKSQHEPDGAKLSEEHCNLRELVQSLSNQEFTYILESFFEFL
jgi:hypothetical protein